MKAASIFYNNMVLLWKYSGWSKTSKMLNLKSKLLRPDLFEQNRRISVDQKIRQNMVPRLLADFNIPKESRSRVNSRLFKGARDYAWITKTESRDNAA